MRLLYIFLVLFGVIFSSCEKEEKPIDSFYAINSLVSPLDSGTIVLSANSPYKSGLEVFVTAVANSGFKFSHWEGGLSGQEKSQSIVMDSNVDVRAVFLPLNDFASEQVTVYEESLIDASGLILMMENGQNQAYLVDHDGQKQKEWTFDSRFGNDIEITPSGNFLACFKVSNPSFSFGGFGGHIQKLSPNGTLIWEYVVNTEDEIAHHDATELPNGHILIMVWERIGQNALAEIGLTPGHDVYLEKLIEVNPENNQIVWQWRSWDHVIQDVDSSKNKFGKLNEYPNKINIAYNNLANGDWMHANGIHYDPSLDVVYMSVNFYSEVWVIDHSTSTQEASSDTGGSFGRGGDLVYRFGNPGVFDHDASDRFLFKNHHPSIVPLNYPGGGHFLIYNNGSNLEQSSALELRLPTLNGQSMQDYIAPNLVWSFTDSSMYFDKISGLVRLPNGNTLICEGDFGYWEVTPDSELAWKYDGLGKSFWRGYFYEKNDPRLLSFELTD